MNKKDEVKVKDKKFHLALIVSCYLMLDVIVLFILCLLEVFFKVDHDILLIASMIIEVFMMLIVLYKGNIRSAIIFYILLLVSPAFLVVLANCMHFITDADPFTPIVLLLFRTGYDLKGVLLGKFIRMILFFRIPALITLLIYSLNYYIKYLTRKRKAA